MVSEGKGHGPVAWVGYPKSLSYGPQSLSLSIAGLDFEPNLWMWVDPNIMFPPGKLEVPEPSKGKNLTTTAPPLSQSQRRL